MVLKRIELCGFKSFPDKTVLEFPEGITAIVGSNGCGKSNVSDAVRWVLGEQSAKSLRGDKMEDLIFAGTATRKPMGFAEVILTFDNSRKLFPIEFTEVSIGRRLFRDGQSVYLLNKQECRLRDVFDLLMDSGIGRRVHSIIEQGKIDEIVMARPEERRHLIEEAAGIAKYRSRRTEAFRRLENTRESLRRVDDLLAELERQEASLQRASRKAERFREVQAELRRLELAHAAARLEELGGRGKDLVDRRAATEAAITTLDAEAAEIGLEIEGLKGEREAARSAMREAALELGNAESASMAAESQLREMKVRQSADESSVAAIGREISALESRIAEATTARRGSLEAIAALEEMTTTLGAATADVALRTESLKRAADEAHERHDAARTLEATLGEALARAESERTHLSKAGEDQRERAAEFTAEIARIRAERAAVEERRALLESELNGVLLRRDSLVAERTDLQESERILEGETASLSERAATADRERAVFASRLSSAESRLKADRERLDATGFAELAPVAQVIASSSEYAAALAGALGETARGAVLPAGSSIDLAAVSEALRGRAVLPFAAMGCRDAWAPRPGLTPLAFCLSSIAPPSIAALLAGWYLAATAEDAAALLSTLDDRERIVTLDGDVFYPFGGVRRTGVEESDELLCGRDALVRSLRSAEEARASIAAEVSLRRDALASIRLRLNRVEESIQATGVRRTEIQGALTSLEERLATLDPSSALAGEREASAEASRAAERLESLQKEIETSSASLATAQEERASAAERLAEANRGIEEMRRRQSSLELELNSATERLAARRNESERLAAWIVESSSSRDRNAKMLEDHRERLEALGAAIDELNRNAGELASDLERKRARFASCETGMRDLETRIAKSEEMHRSIQRSREDSLKEMHVLEVEGVRLDGEANTINELIRKEYGPEAVVQADRSALDAYADLAAAAARVEELREMLSRMGGVNFAAAEELAEISSRVVFYRTQRGDLAGAEDGLSQVVSDIDRKTLTLFNETFAAVNTNFGLLFNRLFGARADLQGSAELVLLDPANPLESGIDIIAMPPGKKPQTISLLSGGEKALTAVALLFSVFLVRPSPFAVLDELDAPLDEANVGKYVQLLREFSQRSQFIIITHNKRTMEAADTLYGVSQTEKGISRLIGVKLSDEDTIPEAAG